MHPLRLYSNLIIKLVLVGSSDGYLGYMPCVEDCHELHVEWFVTVHSRVSCRRSGKEYGRPHSHRVALDPGVLFIPYATLSFCKCTAGVQHLGIRQCMCAVCYRPYIEAYVRRPLKPSLESTPDHVSRTTLQVYRVIRAHGAAAWAAVQPARLPLPELFRVSLALFSHSIGGPRWPGSRSHCCHGLCITGSGLPYCQPAPDGRCCCDCRSRAPHSVRELAIWTLTD